MAGTFTVDWLPGGVLLQRRTGVLTPEQAKDYVAAVQRAITAAPPSWGVLVDARDAAPQNDEVQALIQGLIKYTVDHDVKRVAVVTKSAITGIQQRRITTAPGMHDMSTIAFFSDYDVALSGLVRELAG
jgi:hypothetical protein